MTKKILLLAILTLFIPFALVWDKPAIAALPNGNRIKDPYAILRNALPINQKDLREIQNGLEETSDLVRGGRWPAISKATSRSKSLLNNRKKKIIDSIPNTSKKQGEQIIISLKEDLENLNEQATAKNKAKFIDIRRKALQEIGDLESLFLPGEFPYKIPNEFDNLPRLLGRATVSIETTKGKMNAVIDGYNAPLTAGAFVDLVEKGFYDGLPMNRAEEFFVLQTGDPKGPEIGYIDPETKQERNVPLEIRVDGQSETIYNETFEELGLYTSTPTLPFATLGTLGWAHSEQALDDGSSQFFFFLYEAELNPAGRNLIDGRNAAFGYVIEGNEILNELGVNDQIISIKVLNGSEKLKSHA
ncbi:peptidylprolyl isomerase [Prochlorococcus marinus]|uniref:peptidylprolyl isomerase n=1 Tax=Prochlorococcus marinus (strain MIT 9211) TaxID=93059 RepID=A9B9I1_PROM4|nr:peptidylprolyl isomerase [Prochlorococcus marinus]ABX07956.1 Cyclophilin-type peptidyl-prolyl cis-trans isomerase [Prochlorococcus marinus str. MIT 9211]